MAEPNPQQDVGNQPVAQVTDIATRDKIIEAAIDLFARKGFEAASMQEIAEAVGIKKSSLYSHFKGKDQILETILKEFIGELGRSVHQQSNQATAIDQVLMTAGPEGLMDTAWKKFNDSMEQPRIQKIWRMIAIEMCRNAMIRSFFERQLIDGPTYFWEKAFRAMMEKSMIKTADPAVLAREYYAFSVYLFLKYLLLSCDTDYERIKADAYAEASTHTRYFLMEIKA
jgi:AcrR family transcriptional regulator